LERFAKWHLKRQVKDPELRQKLTPSYTIGCKRILISDNYYPALDQPNVDVVTEQIKEIGPHSIVTMDGVEREVDTILWGTGFAVTEMPLGPAVRGRGGLSLADHWQGSPTAHAGVTVAGFPNLFILVGPNSGLGHSSMIYMIESQLNYVVDGIAKLERSGAATFEVREDVQAAFNDKVQKSMKGTVWTAEHCKSWYLDRTGKNRTLWPTYTWRYRRATNRFNAEEYELAPASSPAHVSGAT
jgi:cation diffusion facilitator CzcD-associated flavoprotein CzcO